MVVHVQVERTLLLSGEWKVKGLRIPTENYMYSYVPSDNSGLFYVRFTCHKSSQNTKLVATDVFFQGENASKPFSAGAPPRTPLGAYDAPQIP